MHKSLQLECIYTIRRRRFNISSFVWKLEMKIQHLVNPVNPVKKFLFMIRIHSDMKIFYQSKLRGMDSYSNSKKSVRQYLAFKLTADLQQGFKRKRMVSSGV
jgi:hypothetical protein